MYKDNISRGPARWQRAALNAVRRPHSKGAELYRSRVAVAERVACDELMREFTRAPFEHRRGYSKERRYVTCSVYCTVMQLTLDCGTTNAVTLGYAFQPLREGPLSSTWSYAYVIPLTTPAKRRCEVCGTRVVVRR